MPAEEFETLTLNDIENDVVIEARLKTGISKQAAAELEEDLHTAVIAVSPLKNWSIVSIAENQRLAASIDRVLVGSCSHDVNKIMDVNATASIRWYTAREIEPLVQEIRLEEASEECVIASTHWELPCRQFDELWTTLIFDTNIKNELLSYALGIVRLSQLGVNTDLLDVNRLILLHGPPGTGKSTLCKALAQRVAVRLNDIYKKTILVEINSHSLFSKYFSESGKLVQKLFEEIAELAADADWHIVVMIDEVESLAMKRSSALGADPTDSVRAVNAVLTQIDKLRAHPNVLIVATSNITGCLDLAFLDRTDLSLFVGEPCPNAAAQILLAGLREFERLSIFIDRIADEQLESRLVAFLKTMPPLSGRLLKKAPVVAYSKLHKRRVTTVTFVDTLNVVIADMSRHRCKRSPIGESGDI